jgi:regulator of cell morphogenesis and NO signaling
MYICEYINKINGIMTYNENSNIGEVVAQDYKTAVVFKSHNIDFCCNGNRTISDAAEKKKIDVRVLMDELNNIPNSTNESGIDFNSWPVDLLADYIQRIHHTYVNEKLPVLIQLLDKLRKVHGGNHPELYRIYDLFEGAALDLTQHMKKEEMILFPYAREVGKSKKGENQVFASVENPVNVMMHEHENEGDRFREIRDLTNQYTPPADGCTTYRVAFSLLEEFEDDLHKHIHLENNILFPKLVSAGVK